jgi:hypothetical protein
MSYLLDMLIYVCSASLDNRPRCPGRYKELANQAFFSGTLFGLGQKKELVHAKRRKQAAVAEASCTVSREEGWPLWWPAGGLDSVVKIKRIKLQLGIPLNLCDLHLDLSSDRRGWFISCSTCGGR